MLYNFPGPVSGPGMIIARESGPGTFTELPPVPRQDWAVYRLSTSSEYTVLRNFTGAADGTGSDGVTLDPAGNLYGVGGGGTAPAGLVYEIKQLGRIYGTLYLHGRV